MKKVQIRTKNPSAKPLKGSIKSPFRCLVRLGSRTPAQETFAKVKLNRFKYIEINSIEAIEISRDKLRMKEAFASAGVSQAKYSTSRDPNTILEECGGKFPLVGKHVLGSKGRGMVKLDTMEELQEYLRRKGSSNIFFEKFYNYAREYRIHINYLHGPFMIWRKLRRSDCKERWFFNNENCNWVNPKHELFDKPSNMDQVIEEAHRAMEAVGLDIGAIDLRIQSNSTSKKPKFIICEINSAPQLGEQGINIYREAIEQMIEDKIKSNAFINFSRYA